MNFIKVDSNGLGSCTGMFSCRTADILKQIGRVALKLIVTVILLFGTYFVCSPSERGGQGGVAVNSTHTSPPSDVVVVHSRELALLSNFENACWLNTVAWLMSDNESTLQQLCVRKDDGTLAPASKEGISSIMGQVVSVIKNDPHEPYYPTAEYEMLLEQPRTPFQTCGENDVSEALAVVCGAITGDHDRLLIQPQEIQNLNDCLEDRKILVSDQVMSSLNGNPIVCFGESQRGNHLTSWISTTGATSFEITNDSGNKRTFRLRGLIAYSFNHYVYSQYTNGVWVIYNDIHGKVQDSSQYLIACSPVVLNLAEHRR